MGAAEPAGVELFVGATVETGPIDEPAGPVGGGERTGPELSPFGVPEFIWPTSREPKTTAQIVMRRPLVFPIFILQRSQNMPHSP